MVSGSFRCELTGYVGLNVRVNTIICALCEALMLEYDLGANALGSDNDTHPVQMVI